MTSEGLPPKAAMLSWTHLNANLWSWIPALPVDPSTTSLDRSLSEARKPKTFNLRELFED